jgi:hypothetical protein
MIFFLFESFGHMVENLVYKYGPKEYVCFVFGQIHHVRPLFHSYFQKEITFKSLIVYIMKKVALNKGILKIFSQ